MGVGVAKKKESPDQITAHKPTFLPAACGQLDSGAFASITFWQQLEGAPMAWLNNSSRLPGSTPSTSLCMAPERTLDAQMIL